MNAFASRFAKKFGAISTRRDETTPVIEPGNICRDTKQHLELRAPSGALERKQAQLEIA